MSWLPTSLSVGVQWSGGGLNLVALARRLRKLEVLDWLRVDDAETPAAAHQVAEWLARNRAAAAPVTACMPRTGVLVRFLNLPAKAEAQLTRVVGYQLDALHPFGSAEIAWDCAVVSRDRAKGEVRVIVVIAEKARLDTLRKTLSRLGLRPASLTLTATALVPLLAPVLPAAALVLCGNADGVELIGFENGSLCASREIAAVPVEDARDRFERELHGLRASFSDVDARVPTVFVCGDLPEVFSNVMEEAARLPSFKPPIETSRRFDLSAHLATISAACAGLRRRSRQSAPAINLVPMAERVRPASAARMPTIALGATAAALALVAAGHSWIERQMYVRALERQIRRLEPAANAARMRGQQVSAEEARAALLESVRQQTWSKLERLQELTRLLPDGTWVQDLQMTEDSVELAGSSDRAAELIKVLEDSPMFEQVEFTSPITRDSQNKEVMRIRMRMEQPRRP